MIEAALATLIDKINGGGARQGISAFKGELVIRKSTGNM
jgi:DNA-binding LacI/PurR family transcriptional regulator